MHSQNKVTQATMTPAKALELLVEGNKRFRNNLKANRNLLEQVEDTGGGQWPFAAVLGCIDSRVSSELVFDQGVGDVFSIRIAGNFVNEDILGSLEFSCSVAGAKLIVVLGHKSCGAIKGACDGVELGHLTQMLAKLHPALDSVLEPSDASQRTAKNEDFVQAVAEQNVRLTMARILDESEVLRKLHEAGDVDVVGGMYDVASGAVEILKA